MLLVVMVFTSTIPVFAEKVHFDITIGSGGNDPKSPRGSKGDDEQRYYVTSYYFSRDAFYYAKSKRLSDDKSSNENVYVASYSGQQKWSDNAAYGWYAKPGIYFYLYGWTSGAQLRTKGYYNP